MITQDKAGQLAVVLESTLHVETLEVTTMGHFMPDGVPGPTHSVRMPNEVWREFCRRQLAVPPPLPKGKKI